MAGLRTSLNDILGQNGSPPQYANIGLWLDRYFSNDANNPDESAKAKQEHLQKALKIDIPQGYREFFALRKRYLEAMPHTCMLKAQVIGLLAVGLGTSSVWENNVELHHTWGMPMIPGSALKGLAASFAHTLLEDNEWRRRLASEEQGGGDSHNLLFGTTEEQGLVTFHDALWDPNSKNKCLSLDTVTVHHREYYQDGPATSPPTDWDSPIPIPFLSMTGNFLFALTGPPQWVHAAQQILEVALLHMGIGAKTSSGYGRMQLTVELSETEQVLQNIYRRIERFVFPDKPGQMQKIKQELEVLCHENINREQKQDILKRFFQKANQLDKPIRKDVRNYLKQSLDNWPNTEEKELLDKIWDAVFSETTKTPTEDATSQKNAEQVSSHNLNWTEKVSELIQEMSTLTEENLKKALPNWITSTFNSTPSKKELMTFLTTFESTLKEKYNLSGKDVKTLRDSAKKLIRKHNF